MRLARLTQRSEFLAAADHGRRFRSSAFTAQVLDREEPDVSGEKGSRGLRLGLTASRKTGNSVKRNRIRRRLRAAAALALAGQTARPCDVVVVARPETLTADFATLVQDLSVAIARARPQKAKTPRSHSPKSHPQRGRSGGATPSRL